METGRGVVRRMVGALVLAALVASGLPLIGTTTPEASAATLQRCSSAMTAENGLTATPSHGQVFYVDSKEGMDAAYAGYKIANTGASRSGLWAAVDSFSGGKVGLANPADRHQDLGTIAPGGSETAFFLLRAPGGTTMPQTHTVRVYDRRPDLAGATQLMACYFTFAKVQETIKAGTNSVSTPIGLSAKTAVLGDKLTVTVNGNSGQLGAGSAPDSAILWFSPAAFSSWPTRSLRLESTSISISQANNSWTLSDQLMINSLPAKKQYAYQAQYTFRVIGPAPAGTKVVPIAQIASGTQVKHTDVSALLTGTANELNLSGVAATSMQVSKAAGSTPATSDASSATINYTVTVSTTSASTLVVDEIVDTPAAGVTLKSNSAKIIDGTRGTATAIVDPVALASESSQSPTPLHFVGPFTLSSTRSAVLTYQAIVPCSSTPTGYANTAYAKAGDLKVGATASTIPVVTVTTATAGTSCGATVQASSQSLVPTAQTQQVTGLSATGATLNGFANAMGVTGTTALFRYSTTSNLSSSSTTTASSVSGTAPTARSSSIGSLSPATTYYYRLEVSYPGGTAFGETLTFVTPAQQAVPTVVTDPVSSLTDNSAILNGRINPNLTDVSKVTFVYATTSALVSGSTPTGTQEDVYTADASDPPKAVLLTLTGSGDQPVATIDPLSATSATTVTALQSGTTYFYLLRAWCTVNATYCPNGYVDGQVLSFTTGAPSVTTLAATAVAGTSATVNGTVVASGSVTKTFQYCMASATCTSALMPSDAPTVSAIADGVSATSVYAGLTGLMAGTDYFFRVSASTTSTSFGAILSFRTLDITTASSLPGGSAGTPYAAQLDGTGGSSTYTWSITANKPNWLTIDPVTGALTGTPPSPAQAWTFAVTLSDDIHNTTTTKDFTIVVGQSVTLSYDANNATSGTVPAEQSAESGTPFTVRGNTGALDKSGYSFDGWYSNAAGTGALPTPLGPERSRSPRIRRCMRSGLRRRSRSRMRRTAARWRPARRCHQVRRRSTRRTRWRRNRRACRGRGTTSRAGTRRRTGRGSRTRRAAVRSRWARRT